MVGGFDEWMEAERLSESTVDAKRGPSTMFTMAEILPGVSNERLLKSSSGLCMRPLSRLNCSGRFAEPLKLTVLALPVGAWGRSCACTHVMMFMLM